MKLVLCCSLAMLFVAPVAFAGSFSFSGGVPGSQAVQKGRQRAVEMSLSNGAMRSVVGKGGMSVGTQGAVALAPGTEFFIRTEGDLTEVFTVEHEVRVRSSDPKIKAEVLVPEGFRVRVRDGEAPLDPERFTRNLLDSIRVQTMAKAGGPSSGGVRRVAVGAAKAGGSTGSGASSAQAGAGTSGTPTAQVDTGSSAPGGGGSGAAASSGSPTDSPSFSGMRENALGDLDDAEGSEAGVSGETASLDTGSEGSFATMEDTGTAGTGLGESDFGGSDVGGADMGGADIEGGDLGMDDVAGDLTIDMTDFQALENLEDAFVTDNVAEEIQQESSGLGRVNIHIGIPAD